MIEIKTKPTKASVKKYMNAIKDPLRRADCETIAKIMEKETGEKPVMWGNSLVGFGSVTMTYASGRKINWLKIGFASRKDAISLYLTCDLDEYEDLLKDLGMFKRGVGCLYIKKLADVNMSTLRKLIKKATKVNQ
jgi:hypothetical protein